jgi:hypothetical protein
MSQSDSAVVRLSKSYDSAFEDLEKLDKLLTEATKTNYDQL